MTSSVKMLKYHARIALKGFWSAAVSGMLIYAAAMILAASLMLRLMTAEATTFRLLLIFGIGLILKLLTSLLRAGLINCHLIILRRERPKISALFAAFRSWADRYLFVELILTAAEALYAGGLILIARSFTGVLLLPALLIWTAAGGCLLAVLSLTLALTTPLFLTEADLSFGDGMRKSAALMKGQRLRLLRLIISYIGWFVPAVFTGGLSLLWTTPYLLQSTCGFFREVMDQYR